jgi:HD-GYP domain-containing protein (c-di-GMP phosphodiesterase class II)
MSRLRTIFGNLFHLKNSDKISSDVTAINGICIARVGDVIDQEFLNNLKSINVTANYIKKICDMELFGHLGQLLDTEKYKFIAALGPSKKQILDLLGKIEFSELIYKELNWMSRLSYRYHHCLAVVLMVARIMMDLSKSPEQVMDAASCVFTHDIGITRVPRNILQKISSLNPDEMQIIREHPIYSYILLTYYFGDCTHLNAQVGFTHHEDLMGQGYPQGIAQENFISRCIYLCDYYDALISDRPFRPAMKNEEALELIEKCVDEQRMDKEVFSVFKNFLIN